MRTDAFMFACYRRHCANSITCGCNIDGPERTCDLGWALWKCAHPRKVDVQ